ncbi:MAG: DUF4214 domain-containing protein [Pigmentiphaga sp.]
MTTLNLHLTSKMQAQLQHPGVWASAVYFIDGQPHWIPLVTNGQGGTEAVEVALPDYLNGGKVYILIQSGDSKTDPFPALIHKESDISIATAHDHDIRFDSIELTLGVSSSDAGNLTSVTGFGLPMQMEVHYTDGSPSQSAGYHLNGTTIFQQLQAIDPSQSGLVFNFTSGPLAEKPQPRYATSPASASEVSPTPFTPNDWNSYLKELLKLPGTIAELGGIYNGAADAQNIWHNQGFYHYKLVSDGKEYFWLVPEAHSQIQGYVRISLDDLANSIYATQGTAQVFLTKGAHDPFLEMNVGVNNQWGKLFTELLTGFSAGFYGGVQGTPVNPQDHGHIDLSQNWNWMPNYAFGANVTGKPSGWHIDPYSEFFFKNSNSYGSMYSDNLMQGYTEGGPLLSLANADTINLTVYADDEDPKGYITPKLYNYLNPPSSNGYDPAGTDYSAVNLTLGLALAAGGNGQTSWMANPANTVVTIDFLAGYDGDHTPIWKSVVLDSHLPGANGSLWWNWSIQYNAGSGHFEAKATPDTAQTAGNLVLTGLPMPANGTAWTKITVADAEGGHAKTFNLYSTTHDGAFVHDAAKQAIDGGAVIALPHAAPGTATVNTYSINLLSGSSTFLDPSLLVPGGGPNALPMLGTPAAPVVGVRHEARSPFEAVAGQDSLTGGNVHTLFTDETHNLVSFGWTGTNAGATDLSSWLRSYTNKVGALDIVRLDILRQDDAKATHITTQADLDGQWTTPGHVFAPGTYSVSMISYDTHDTNFASPLSAASSVITLIVDSDRVGAVPAVSRLELQHGLLALDTAVGDTAGVAYRLYQAALDRAPDPEGLGYWLGALDSGELSPLQLARQLLESEEFIADDGIAAHLSDAEFLDMVYQYLFDRDPDADGERYWLEQMDAGVEQATVLLAIAESPETLTTFAGGVEHGLWLI